MSELIGKRALVTGASRGIGAAIALALAEKGADVAITYSGSPDRAAQVVKAIQDKGRNAIAIQADVGDPAAIKRSVADAVDALGGLDILVNNAAIAFYNLIADISADEIDAMFRVNVRGPILTAQAAIPHLPTGGRIVTIGSAGAERIIGEPGSVYYMTKSALQSFNRGLARELGARGITVNLVQPGSTDTEANPANGESADFQRSLSPLGRFGEPADVAAAVAFFASPAAKHITGAILNVDGGQLT
jgi:3-oxoacyl-[acyl-carrier protein] reductase